MVERFPANARAHAIIWPAEDKYFFRKLRLFALNHIQLFNADEAAEVVLSLEADNFWDREVRRELLFLLHDRWENFSKENQVALADRLLNGPNKMDHWSADEYPKFRDELACRYTRWLTLKGRVLSKDQTKRLNEKLSRLPSWNDDWVLNFVTEHGMHFTRVGIDEAPDAIIDLPVNQIVEQAKAEHQNDFANHTEKHPFTGLVKANPRKALASLSYSAKKGDYPQAFWSDLISEWPEDIRPRLLNVFLNRLSRLPNETIRENSYTVGRWIENRFLPTFTFDKELAWKIFDHLVSGLNSEGGVATKSGIGEARIGGEVVQKSRRTYGHAINGPIGNAAQGLIYTLDSLKLEQGDGIPEDFKARFERLIATSGEGADHAVSILTRQIHWLYYRDPEWVMNRIMPWFNFEHSVSEPAWNGYLSAKEVPIKEVGTNLKPLLLKLFPLIYQWSWQRNLVKIAVEITVELAVFRSDQTDGLSPREARQCLRNMNDQNRQEAVFRLGQIGQREKDGWLIHVMPFINTVWPRERGFRTSTLVSSWISLLSNTGEDFPAVLSVVRRFLVPVEGEHRWLYRFSREVSGEHAFAIKYPEAVLELLDAVVPNSAEDAPHELAQILALVEEADSILIRDHRFLRLINLIEQK